MTATNVFRIKPPRLRIVSTGNSAILNRNVLDARTFSICTLAVLKRQGVYSRPLHLFPEAGLVPIPTLPADHPRSSRFKIAARSRCFDGHFEGVPILPGVAHLALALTACANEVGGRRVVAGLRDFRLMHPLRPDDEVDVVLTEGKDPCSVRFAIHCQGVRASVGLLIFTSSDERPLTARG